MENIYSKILVAVDGSLPAEWAFENAVDIAKRNNAKLYIAYVIDETLTISSSHLAHLSTHFLNRTEKLIDTYVQEAKKYGVDATGIVRLGIPKIVLSEDLIEELDIDLIVCGSSGLSGIKRVLIGSISEGIVRYSPCDVIVIKQHSIPDNYTAPIVSKFNESENN